MALTKNQIISLEITGASADGNGIGRYVDAEHPAGMVVFVPYTAIGDKIRCRITKAEKSCAFGRVEELLTPSPDRCDPGCAVFGKCGGCAWRHVSYQTELAYKEAHVADCVKRIGKVDLPVSPIVGAPSEYAYRNKAQYPVAAGDNGPLIGFYAPRSHRIIGQRECALQPPVFAGILQIVEDWMKRYGVIPYDEEQHRGLLRHIYIRRAEQTGEIMVCLVCTSGKVPQPDALVDALRRVNGVVSVLVNINREKTNVILGRNTFALWGKDSITDTLCGLQFRLSPLSFYQVNRTQAERLYGIAADMAELTGNETLLDLYCGTGTIGLSMANRVKMLVGAEIVSAAVEDARRNAAENRITNARFLCGDASEAARQLEKEGIRPGVIVVDPPRKGCDEDVLHTIARMSPKKLVYISCNPATLARDLARLDADGYVSTQIVPVDMFPRTAHVETVALLSRKINVHKMKLHSAPFEMIKSGQKTIELRLFDEKRRQVKAGDTIVFTNSTTGETIETTVLKVHRFDSFEELYKSLPLLKCGYTTEDVDDAKPSDMERYYSAEEQRKYGVAGIELCRVKNEKEGVCGNGVSLSGL